MYDTDATPDGPDLLDLLQETGFTPCEEQPAGRPGAVMFDRDRLRMILDDGHVEIHVFGPDPARILRWSVTFSPATPLLVIINVLHGAGVPVAVPDMP
ncbi:hypothetical protein [Frankia sp. CiP3]|uniref:hypothetical protein n=1 Tax=Frankia sp. CiP3 TaxID=2880971 RepID=UPI001EF5C69A|nr:hypothetical protein [Frankia sp. CiP3]